MRIFYNGDAPNISVSACPAGHLPAVECPKQWFEEDGKTPQSFSVQFRDGEAIVDEALGKYLVVQKIALTSKIILPSHVHRLVA